MTVIGDAAISAPRAARRRFSATSVRTGGQPAPRLILHAAISARTHSSLPAGRLWKPLPRQVSQARPNCSPRPAHRSQSCHDSGGRTQSSTSPAQPGILRKAASSHHVSPASAAPTRARRSAWIQ
jgi:hypothetical protein